ncbi:tetratricopeptide repeat protein [Halioxenophilus sp. WMMB6]|uniref:tetratricopeptide repeat protein n=1 Tax=Halioxenophilus sp. WMMB6 TaxID=3073815 RepID=UPI00295ED6EC|nr:tetratricopeptide repeat protein [Halioxenophilus sp. WMMB6]
MPFFILSVLIQVALVIHIVKTGRNTTWIWIVVMLPLAGTLAYLILEVLPEFSHTRAGRSARRKVNSVVNPNRDFNAATRHYAMNDSVENSKRLAEECYSKGLYSDAKTLYQKCLQGPYADDPHFMFGLASCEFQLGNYSITREILDRLIEANPDYKNQSAHLLYARTLEQLQAIPEALHEYETLYSYFTGPDAAYYFGKFLQSQNQNDRARQIFQAITDGAKQAPKHYSQLHKEILRLARSELSQ